jgi:hypothetical protein
MGNRNPHKSREQAIGNRNRNPRALYGIFRLRGSKYLILLGPAIYLAGEILKVEIFPAGACMPDHRCDIGLIV